MRSVFHLGTFSILWLLAWQSFAQVDLLHKHVHLPNLEWTESSLEDFLEAKTGFALDLVERSRLVNDDAEHLSFACYLDQLQIYHAQVCFHVWEDGTYSLSFPLLQDIQMLELSGPSPSVPINYIKRLSSYELRHVRTERVWITEMGTLKQAWMVHTETGESVQQSILLDSDTPYVTHDLVCHHHDTIVKALVYKPDPLTSAQKIYGNPFIDAEDGFNTALNDELQEGNIVLRYDATDSLWKLESDVLVALDVTEPSISPPSWPSLEGEPFRTDRSQNDFEYLHAYFHIHHAQERFDQLGFAHWRSRALAYDAHGTLADQSSFIPSEVFPRLSFGDGGIDDAEDADVVVHEYGHALSSLASPNSNFGAERASLEEGMCDFLAIAHSRHFSSFNRETIFDWDGHNEFWNGRSLSDQRSYPSDLVHDIYADGVLWASALGEVADLIGLEVTEQLMLHSLQAWYINMHMSDAAALFLASDSVLFNAEHAELASLVFCARGLLSGCEDTLLSELPLTEPYIGNSYDFAFNHEQLYLYPNSTQLLRLRVISSEGRLMWEKDVSSFEGRFYSYDGQGLPQGAYILQVVTNEGTFHFKILRLWAD
jgi:hypothetical protein